jgi:cytochrome P450
MESKELDETLELHPLDEKTPEQAYGNYSVLRSECPVFRSEKHGGYYVLSKLEVVKEAARNHVTFASAHGHMPAGEARPKSPPIDYDPPEHTAWRKLFAELVSAPSARRMEPHIQRITNELLDPIASLGQCDLVPSFTNLLPLLTLGHLVGLTPDQARHVGELSHRLFSSNQLTALEGRTAARADLIDFGMSLVEDRRRRPQDDWLSELGQSTIDGRPLSAEEISSCLTAIFQAGHHTTASTLAGLLYHVASQPSLRDRLVSEPDLIGVAVEEAIRVETPLHVFPRYVATDAKIGGVDIPRGSVVWLNFASSNRDNETFEEADLFSLDHGSRKHLGFGYGIHTCVGAPLARTELAVALRTVLGRLRNIHLTTTAVQRDMIGGALMRFRSLPVEFKPELRAGPADTKLAVQ